MFPCVLCKTQNSKMSQNKISTIQHSVNRACPSVTVLKIIFFSCNVKSCVIPFMKIFLQVPQLWTIHWKMYSITTFCKEFLDRIKCFSCFFFPKMKHFAKRIEFLGQSDYFHDLQFYNQVPDRNYCKEDFPIFSGLFPQFSCKLYLKSTGWDMSWTGDYTPHGRCHLARAVLFAHVLNLL